MHSGNRNWDCIKILKIAPIGFDVGIIIKMKDLKDRIGWCWSKEKSVCKIGSRKKGPCFCMLVLNFRWVCCSASTLPSRAIFKFSVRLFGLLVHSKGHVSPILRIQSRMRFPECTYSHNIPNVYILARPCSKNIPKRYRRQKL